ncbi:MAG: NAD(P)H-hydrate dehydratase [Saprospirales bacterium]|nr:NAD(P)H-hydrate dehydratase [Saprospirales bacterium]
MKVLNVDQIRQLDAYTIEHEPIASIDLMERAALAFVHWYATHFDPEKGPVWIVCGTGNNGGDGLAIARLLHQRFFTVEVVICSISPNPTSDFQTNLERLKAVRSVPIHRYAQGDSFPSIPEPAILIDGIFGSGLNRPVEGLWAGLIEHLSLHPGVRISIDVPSGLFADRPSTGAVFQAHYTLSFELPKLAFFIPENNRYTGEWIIRSIELDREFISNVPSPYRFTECDWVHSLVKERHTFDHKGTFGHSLLIMGSYGKVGAAILAARACLRTGCGLVTVHAPKCAYPILQVAFPEAMVSVDQHDFIFTQHGNLTLYKAIGIGCGLGVNQLTATGFQELLRDAAVPLLIDADGLNILAERPAYWADLPPNTILTPHPREFDRLFGDCANGFDRLERARAQAQEKQVYIVLKGAYTAVVCPDGTCHFNATGNPGMGTGGTGDVLSGMITSLLAQGYTPRDAAVLGVYLHGLAGDLAAADWQQEALLASDIVKYIGKAFGRVKSEE